MSLQVDLNQNYQMNQNFLPYQMNQMTLLYQNYH
jgi:hypothetical protein